MNFEDGDGALTISLDHPLATAFRRAANKGGSTGSWLYLTYRPALDKPPKLFGTIVWTPGSRFLFFPGRRGEIRSTHKDASLNGKPLDHITLELDRAMLTADEHVAAIGEGRNRGQRRKAKVHTGFLHPWFSLLFHDTLQYQALPAQFLLQLTAPKTDVQRRVVAMMGKGQRAYPAAFPSPGSTNSHYYQVDVWAGRGSRWESKQADALPWRTTSIVLGHQGEEVQAVRQIHRLSTDSGIVSVLSRPSGVLKIAGLVHPTITPV